MHTICAQAVCAIVCNVCKSCRWGLTRACLGSCPQLEVDLGVLRNEVLRSGEAGVQLPVNFRRLIWNAQQIFKCRPHRSGPSGAVPCRIEAPWQLHPSGSNLAGGCACVRQLLIAKAPLCYLCAGLSPLEVILRMRELQDKLRVVRTACHCRFLSKTLAIDDCMHISPGTALSACMALWTPCLCPVLPEHARNSLRRP